MAKRIEQKVITIQKDYDMFHQFEREIAWYCIGGYYVDAIVKLSETDRELIYLLTLKEK